MSRYVAVDEPGAVDRGHRERVRLATGFGTVAAGDRGRDVVEVGAVDERDDAAAEARAGEPGAERAGLDAELDEQVELGRRHREVVAQRPVAREHQRTGRGEVAGARARAANASTRAFSVTT